MFVAQDARIRLFIDHGRLDDAESAIREALATRLEDPSLYGLLGIVLIRKGKPRKAEEAARRGIALEPEWDFCHFVLALALTERHRLREALQTIRIAIGFDPTDPGLRGLEARILFESRKWQAALDAAEAGLAMDPSDDTCGFYRSVALAGMGREAEADAASTNQLTESPDDSGTHNARGWVCFQAGDGAGAERHFVEALRLDPLNDDARAGLVQALRLKNPLLGWALRTVQLVDRMPVWLLLVGAYGLTKLGRTLARGEGYAAVAGDAIVVGFFAFFLFALVVDPIFNFLLLFSPRGRLALSRDERRGLGWAFLPLCLGCCLFVLWVQSGAVRSPMHAVAWFGVASVIAERFSRRNGWVRAWFSLAVVVAIGVAIWTEYADYALVRPQALAMTEQLKQLGSAPDETQRKALLEELLPELQRVAQLRRNLVTLPIFAIWFLAAFRDGIGSWLERRAPDPTR